MKYITTLAFISVCIFSYAQSNMFWNNYSNFNPAMSGFLHEQHASASYVDFYPSLSGNYSDLYANFNQRIAKKHGIGVNYSGNFEPLVLTNKALVNYNYQLSLNRNSKLAAGVGVGYGHERLRDDDYYQIDTTLYADPVSSFQLNLGLAYSWKTLTIGVSATNLIPQDPSPGYGYYYERTPTFNAHAQYRLDLSEKLSLTPRLLYQYYDGFQRLHSNLTLSYKQQFFLGVSAESRDRFGVNIGWDIKNKFRVAYDYSKTFSKLNNAVNGGIHEVSIGYFLTSSKKKIVGTPNF